MRSMREMAAGFPPSRRSRGMWRAPVALLVAGAAALATHGYGMVLAQRVQAAHSDLALQKQALQAEHERARRLSAGRDLLEKAARQGVEASGFLLRSVSYRNVVLPAHEANQVLERTLNGGSNSLVAVQQFRLAAARPGQALWGRESLTTQDSVVLTLVGEQFFRASRP